jgi:hypothetical protein
MGKTFTFGRVMFGLPVALAAAVFVYVNCFVDPSFVAYYEDKMRASLFTGFFTLSGFLLSAKTFIVLNLKKEMFSTKTYLKNFRTQSRLGDPGMKVYGPLRNIGQALLVNVALCLAASILQFSLGLSGNISAVALCLAVASAAAGMLVFSLVVIASNLHDMYDHFEIEAREEMERMG